MRCPQSTICVSTSRPVVWRVTGPAMPMPIGRPASMRGGFSRARKGRQPAGNAATKFEFVINLNAAKALGLWRARSYFPSTPPSREGAARSRARLTCSHCIQVARGLIPRECLRDLACDPVRGRMRSDLDPDEVSWLFKIQALREIPRRALASQRIPPDNRILSAPSYPMGCSTAGGR
jgi:hypothetical protein